MTLHFTPTELEQKRKVAEAATPGEWIIERDCFIKPSGPGIDGICTMQVSNSPNFSKNAAHIAAFSPSESLKLLADLESQRKEIEGLKATEETQRFALATGAALLKELALEASGKINSLTSELAALRQQWTPRPISTAPKDGTHVLVLGKQGWVESVYMDREGTWNDSDWVDPLCPDRYVPEPGLWFPLPETLEGES